MRLVIILNLIFFTYSSKMGKTRKPRDFLMKRKEVLKQKKSRPAGKVLSPFGMLEIMKQRNPEEFAQALRNLKKTCMVCDGTYYGHGTPHDDGVICVDCMDCFGETEINEKSIEIVRAYRRSKDGRRTRVEKFADEQNLPKVCPEITLPEGEEGTDTEHSVSNETPETARQTEEEVKMDD